MLFSIRQANRRPAGTKPFSVEESWRTVAKGEMAKYYGDCERYLRDLQEHDQAYFAHYLALVQRNVRQGSHVCELGCGTGHSAQLLTVAGYRVVACDLSMLFLANGLPTAEGHLGCTYVCTDAARTPFRSESFDAVVSHEFIEHTLEVDRIIEEMVRVVRPGGIVVISAPNLQSPVLAAYLLVQRVRYPRAYQPLAPSVRQTTKLIVQNTARTCSKLLNSRIELDYRQPELDFGGTHSGGDADATYFTSPIDLARLLRRAGCQIIPSPSAGLLGALRPSIQLVARRVAKA